MPTPNWSHANRRLLAGRMALACSRHREVEDICTSDRRRAALARLTVITPHAPVRPGRRSDVGKRKREARYEPLGTF